MNEQLLKDFIATAQKYNYDWNTVFGKFPELNGYDQQVLKDYVATAEQNNYNYDVVNPKFPELGFQPSAPQQEEEGFFSGMMNKAKNLFGGGEEDVKKKEQAASMASPSAESSLVSPSGSNFESILNSINETTLGEDEDDIEDKLGKKLKPLGVNVSQDKWFREAIKLSVGEEGSPDYKEISVPVDNFFSSNDKKSSLELKKWLAENTNKEKIAEQEAVASEFEKATTNEEDFKKSLSSINADLISKDEEAIVPKLQAMFGNYGIGDKKFKFEEVGATDNIKVTAPNGKVFITEVDAFTSEGDKKIAADLKKFIDENKPVLLKAEDNLNKYAKTFVSEKEMEDATKAFSIEADSFKNEVNSALLEKKALEKESKSVMTAEQAADFQKRKQALDNKIAGISEKESKLNSNKLMLDRSVAKYVEWRAEEGGVVGSIWNSFIGGYGSQASSITSLFGDLALSIAPADVMIKDYKGKFLEQALQNGVDVPSLKMSESEFDKWTETLPEDVKNKIESKVVDNAKKEFKKEVAYPSGKALVKTLGVNEVTPEYMEKAQKTTVLQGGAMGVAGSLPAIAGTFAGPGGAKLTVAQFALQGFDATMQEMRGEGFEDISENEKYLVAVPVAILNGVLEEYGLRNMVGKSGVTTSILSTVMGKAGNKATATTFKELVENEVENRLSKGLLTLGAAGLAEAETGGTQQLGELAIKELYNQAKDKQLFQTPNGVSGWLEEIGESAKQEAIGGMIMGSIGAISTAATDNNYEGISDKTLRELEVLRDNETMRSAFVSNLKYEIASGKKTREQAEAELEGYNKGISLYNQIPSDITDAAKRKAFGLLKEKTDLESKIQGKDESLTKKDRERIAEIKNELSKLPDMKEEGVASYSVNGEQMSEEDFADAVGNMTADEIKSADIKATNASESVTNLLKDVATRSGVESAPMMETTAPQEKMVLSSNKKMGDLSEELQNEIDDSGLISYGEIGDIAENKSVVEALDNKIDYHQLLLERENEKDNPDESVVNENTNALKTLNDLKAKVEQENIAVSPAEAPAAPEAQPAKPKTFDDYSDELKPNLQRLLDIEETDLISAEEELAKEQEARKSKGILGRIISFKPSTKYVDDSKSRIEMLKNNPEQYLKDEIQEFEKRREKYGEDYAYGYIQLLKETQSKLQEENAIQEPTTEEGVLRTEQSQVGLPTMGQGNTQQATTQEGVVNEKTQEVKPIEQELTELEQMFPEEGPTGENRGVAASNTQAMDEMHSRATDERVQKVIRTAQRLTKTLKSLIPTADIHLHETDESYNGAMEQLNGNKNSDGYFIMGKNADGKSVVRIDINLSRATPVVVAHEVAHVILQKAFGNNQKLFQSFQEKIAKVLSTDSNQQLLDFANQDAYKEEGVTYEEYMVQLKALLSEQGVKLELSTAKKIAAVINEYVSRITKGAFKPFQEVTDVKQVIDFVNKVTEAMAKGEAIDVEEINFINNSGVNGVIEANDNIQSRSSIISGEIKRFPKHKNVKKEENVKLSRFNKKRVNLMESDRMIGGYIENEQGNPIYNFFGGVFYPLITGKWWASKKLSTAQTIADNANKNRDADGYVYSAPMVGSPNQHMSNSDMLAITLQLMKYDVKNKKSSLIKSDMLSYIDKAFKKKGLIKKRNILKNVLVEKNNINNIFDELEFVLFQDGKTIVDRKGSEILDENGNPITNLSFDERKAIVEGILGNATVKGIKFPSVGSISDAAKRFEEPLTSKAKKIGDLVVVFRTKGTLKAKNSNKKDPFFHKSYNAEIYAVDEKGNPAEIEYFVLDGAYSLRDVFPSLKKSNGEVFTWQDYLDKHKKISEKFAESQYARTSKMSFASGEVISRSSLRVEQTAKALENIDINKVDKILTPSKKDFSKEDGYFKGVSREEAIKAILKNNIIDSKIPLIQDNVLSDFLNLDEKEIKNLEKEGWNKSSNLTKDFENAKGYGDAVIKVNNEGNIIDFDKGYALGKNLNVDAIFVDEKWYNIKDNNAITLSEAYHKAKADGSNPELVKAVEDLIGAGEITSRSSLRTESQIDNIVKQARASGYSEKAIEEFLKKRGVAQEKIDKSLGKKEAGTKVVTNEEMMPGYDRMMAQVDNIIEKGLNRNTNQKNILDNVISYIQGSKAYENATAQQQEEIIRDVKKAFGEKIKPAPSAKRLLGFLKDVKKVTMDEMSLLKKQFKDMAKGAKTAESAINKASRNLTESLKDLVKKGDITTKQMLTVLRKFSKTNLLDATSIDNFVNYMTKVFADADYADKISKAYAQLKVAKKNIKTKIGISEELHPLLSKIFSVNPNLIPDAVFEKYLGLVDMFGQKKQVLKLQNKQDVVNLANEIINSIDEELSLSEELADRFSNYADKVVDANGKVNYADTIEEMVKDNTITEDEAKIMRKYKSKIFPSAKPTPKTDAELAQEKRDLLTALNGVEIDTENLPTHDEREIARKLDRLIRSNAVNEMTNEQLTNLLKVIDNINNGYLPHYSQLMLERLNALNKGADLKNAIDKAKPLSLTKLYARLKSIFTRKDSISEMVRRSPLYYIDQVFGNFKSKDIFDSLFKATAEAETLFRSNITKIQNKLDNAQEAVAKSFKNNPNKTMMSKFKMMTYMIQLEYQSNPNSKQVNPASEYLKATIKHIDEGKSSFGERDADMLQKVLDDYTDSDGNIDIDKLYNSFNEAEKKAIATIREVNESLREKAIHTAAIIRGDKINPLENYVHLNVLHDAQPDDAISGVTSAEAYNNSLRPSTKAKSLIARTGKVAPLNFDVFASAHRGAKFVLMDYYLTEPIRTARKTINEATAMMEKDGRIPKEKRQILNAVSNAFEETTENVLNNVFVTNSFADEVVNYLSKSGYRAVLASVPRFIAELTSNISFALFTDPKALSTGYKYKGVVMSSDAVKILNNVGSKQTNRIFPHEALSGRLIDTSIMSQASGIKGGRSKGDVANVIQMLYNNSLKKYKNSVETLADALISTPDKMVMRPMWIGSFANEFKRITGKDVDFEKIANNDEAYMLDNKDAIDDARDIADQRSVLTGATDNAYMDILKGKVKPNQSALARAFNMFNNYMTRFTIYEYTTARTGIMAAMGNGSLSRKQGVALMAGVTTRMLLYTLLAQTLGSGMVGLFVSDDDDDEKSLGKKFGQSLTSTFTSLLLGRDFGNATKTIVNYGLERVNENYLEALRDGDYDPYKDAIQYSIIPPDVKGKKTTLTDYITNMAGPFAPTLKTADLIARKLSEEPKKTEEGIERSEKEMNVRIPLEILGNAGFIPLYKDIRKITMKNIYKDLEKAEKEAADNEDDNFKPYGLNKEELKKYMPEVYEQYYGEDSKYAKDRDAKSKIRKKKEELRKKMLDEKYNYISPKEKGFGSANFGEGIEKKEKVKKDTFGSAEFGSK